MSYSVWASPLLCSSVAVTLASKIQLTLVYCEALFNVCILPPSDQTMTPNTLLFSLPHLLQAQSVTSQVSRPESLFKTIAFLFFFPFSSNVSSTHCYRSHASLNPLVKYKLQELILPLQVDRFLGPRNSTAHREMQSP